MHRTLLNPAHALNVLPVSHITKYTDTFVTTDDLLPTVTKGLCHTGKGCFMLTSQATNSQFSRFTTLVSYYSEEPIV